MVVQTTFRAKRSENAKKRSFSNARPCKTGFYKKSTSQKHKRQRHGTRPGLSMHNHAHIHSRMFQDKTKPPRTAVRAIAWTCIL